MDFAALKALLDREKIQFLDLKVPDILGRLHHITLPAAGVREQLMVEGIGFDASSYSFSPVEHSDMVLVPDLESCFVEPFRQANTLSCFALIHLADEKRTPFPEDPRAIARRAEDYLIQQGFATGSFWGPEYEFYVFARFQLEEDRGSWELKVLPLERMQQSGYHAESPEDLLADFRDEACLILEGLSIPVKYHHHEGGNLGQCEIETQFEKLTRAADHACLVKHVLKNLAARRQLALTLMPKPLFEQAGNGWHLHVFLEREGENIFYDEGSDYAHLSESALFFMGGVLTHARSLCAFTNPSTNSYKRLVPGFEAPVAITFGRGNRSSACRIPLYIAQKGETRFEYRPPDATANPFLSISAILMAGIDGIRRNLDPRKAGFGPFEKDLSGEEARKKFSFLPSSLTEAVDSLLIDHEYLLQGDVFPRSLIGSWAQKKKEEARRMETYPHPQELRAYF